MSLKVIGAGWGRTGTESLKIALEQLGFGKCYHAFELMKDPSRIPYWLQLEKGEVPDYGKLFDGFQSAVDFPAALYYREFMKQYPDAKVILSTRGADEWYTSASNTILKGMPPLFMILSKLFGPFSARMRMIPVFNGWFHRALADKGGLFDGKIKDREAMIKKFNEWNDEVKQTVPAERLLVFNAKDGWEPLCKFLNVPVPDKPYPHSNAGEKFEKRIRKAMITGEES